MNQMEELFRRIKGYVSSTSAGYTLTGKRMLFWKLVEKMEKDFFLASNDNNVVFCEDDIKAMFETLKYLEEVFIEIPLEANFCSFVFDYCLALQNWNNNWGKNPDLEGKFVLVNRLYQMHLTSGELFEMIKFLLTKLRTMENFAIPSIDLAKHYLKTLDKENTK